MCVANEEIEKIDDSTPAKEEDVIETPTDFFINKVTVTSLIAVNTLTVLLSQSGTTQPVEFRYKISHFG